MLFILIVQSVAFYLMNKIFKVWSRSTKFPQILRITQRIFCEINEVCGMKDFAFVCAVQRKTI